MHLLYVLTAPYICMRGINITYVYLCRRGGAVAGNGTAGGDHYTLPRCGENSLVDRGEDVI